MPSLQIQCTVATVFTLQQLILPGSQHFSGNAYLLLHSGLKQRHYSFNHTGNAVTLLLDS